MENHQKGLLHSTIFASAVAALITVAATSTLNTPIRTSILTGQRWLAELYSSPVRMYEQLGMAKHVFRKSKRETYSSPMILAFARNFGTTFWNPLRFESCLDKCPDLTLPACTRLVSCVLLFLEDAHKDHIIGICPAAACIFCRVVRCVFGAFRGHIIARVREVYYYKQCGNVMRVGCDNARRVEGKS